MDILDPEAAHEHLAAWQDRINQVAADTAALSARLQELRVTARDRMAEVTVDSTGKLVELRLTEEIHRAAPDAVARTIMATLRTAQGQLAARTSEIVNGTVGPSSTTGQAVEARYGAANRGSATSPAGYSSPATPAHHGSATSQGGPAHHGYAPAPSPPPRRPQPPAQDEVDVSVTDSSPAPAYSPPPRRPRPPADDDDFSVSVTEEG